MPKKSGEGATKRSRTSNKDPNAPKRPLNAYMIYSAEQRVTLKSSDPDLKGPKLLKKIAAQWKQLDESGKSKYQKQTEELKKKYEEEMKNYNPPEEKKEEGEKPEEKKTKRTRKAKKNDEESDDE